MAALLANNDFTPSITLNKVLMTFFKDNNPDTTKVLFWKFFQCWVTRECNIKADLSDEEVALFFDQLMDLVAAAYILHQANRVLNNGQEGSSHE